MLSMISARPYGGAESSYMLTGVFNLPFADIGCSKNLVDLLLLASVACCKAMCCKF
jgi:hypothetical protein